MNKKNGFTLAELLAVIVILAVILVIAVPSIISTITEARKGALASSAKLIASSAESMKISNQALGIDSEITCEDVANISSEDYETCKIDFINGEAKVTLVGKGKFEGMGVLLGTKDNSVATYGLEEDDTADKNIRYVGSNPSNYVEFGNTNELWRIIGIFNMTTADGKQEKLMKIIRNDSIGNYAWDLSDSTVNAGNGVNQWGESTHENGTTYEGADLMIQLNDSYLNQTGDFANTNAVKGINSISRNMIENVEWITGAIEYIDTIGMTITPSTAYMEERGTKGKICISDSYCNDTIARTSTWEGRVGLTYPSDYGYAAESCNNMRDTSCQTNNWLKSNLSYWTLSSTAYLASSTSAWFVNHSGNVGCDSTSHTIGVRPSVYLKSNASIIGGEGTKQNPYKLSGN